ncbi:MAG: ABC transporter permease [Chloroflexi bacterium]|nr:ABC transporter permease [Chloroflexota bacterium]
MSTSGPTAASIAPVPAGSGPVTVARARRLPRPAQTFLRGPLSVFGAVVILVLALAAIWPAGALPHDPYESDISVRLIPPAWEAGGGAQYLLGTDALGRDMLSMMIHGARYSLSIVGLAVLLSLVAGVALGLMAGYWRGWVDELVMRLVDIQLAFPLVVLVIAIVAVLGPNFVNLVIVLGVAGWAPFARLVRGTVLSIREKEFVESARALGAGPIRIMTRHLLPNSMTSIIIYLTFDIARLLLLESSLAFLGLGVQPPTPSWGAMIADGRQYLFEAWWDAALPGAAIILAVLAFNFVGDGLRDALDPLSRQQE